MWATYSIIDPTIDKKASYDPNKYGEHGLCAVGSTNDESLPTAFRPHKHTESRGETPTDNAMVAGISLVLCMCLPSDSASFNRSSKQASFASVHLG